MLRYTTPVDNDIPVPALLYDDEQLIASQDNVGLYDGPSKSAPHQSGILHLTSHRIFFISSSSAPAHTHASLALDLLHVARTDHYAGFFTSSPKVSLHLAPLPNSPSPTPDHLKDDDRNPWATWECPICAYRNPPGLSPAARSLCALCGVPRPSTPAAVPSPSRQTPIDDHPRSLPSSTGPTPTPRALACPACTFLNHPSLHTCEICGTALQGTTTTLPLPNSKSAPSSRPPSPDPIIGAANAGDKFIRLSFRKGGDKPFYAALKRTLLAKGWEAKHTPGTATGRLGISGILQNVESSAQHTSSDMSNAFKDLEALMVKAKDMVRLAAELNERLSASANGAADTGIGTTSGAGVEPEEATFIRSSLAQLGLQMKNAPVTLDMVTDERRWMEQLAAELAGVLQGDGKQAGVMGHRGIVGLDEAWGGWNRARGVALIPPATLLQTLAYLPAHSAPALHARTLASGLTVLHTPAYARAAFAARLVARIGRAGPCTAVRLAGEEGLSVALVEEMVREAEDAGAVCRDEVGVGGGGGEVRWWVNSFETYVWDGQVG